jgi:hypothetical protein
VFEAIEWPDNYTNINVTKWIEMMVARFFMVSSMTHYVQTYLLGSHLLGTCLDMTVVYMDTS